MECKDSGRGFFLYPKIFIWIPGTDIIVQYFYSSKIHKFIVNLGGNQFPDYLSL